MNESLREIRRGQPSVDRGAGYYNELSQILQKLTSLETNVSHLTTKADLAKFETVVWKAIVGGLAAAAVIGIIIEIL